jgi:hypothetical protein
MSRFALSSIANLDDAFALDSEVRAFATESAEKF